MRNTLEFGRRLAVLVVGTVVLCPTLAGRASAQDDVVGGPRLVNAVVGSVDGRPITLDELKRFEEGRGKLLSAEERKSRATMLDAIVKSRLFHAEFERYGITATDEEVGLYIDRILADGGSTRQQVTAALRDIGLSWEDYFERMREEVQKFALINREIRARVNVTPEEVKRYWEDNPQYVREDSVEIGHIYIGFPPRADDAIRAKVRNLADEACAAARRDGFEDAARRYSGGPTAADGGVLGIFGRGQMAPEFASVIEDLDEGEVSDPFEAGGAIHILKLIKKYPPGRVPFDDVRERIRAKLYEEALDTRFKRWVDEDLRKRHHIRVLLGDLPDLPGA